MKVLTACGGTGGHIYPGIAVSSELRNRHPDWEFMFIGCSDLEFGLENKLVPEAGFKLVDIDADNYESWYSFKRYVKSTFHIIKSVFQSMGILIKYRPDVVIGTGGFVCAPVLLSAKILGFRSLILEQNVIPGRTNRFLSGMANRICISFEESRRYMKKPDNCVMTGNPLRKEFDDWTRESARKELGLEDEDRLMLIFGGSLGAVSLNKAAVKVIGKICTDSHNKVIFITGGENYGECERLLNEEGISFGEGSNVTLSAYRNDMPVLMNASDIIVSRSGATTIAEINHVGTATIYVPLKHAPNDHQRLNAKANVDRGAAMMYEDDEDLTENLIDGVTKLISDRSLRESMAEASAKLGVADSCDRICDIAESLACKKK